MGYWLKGATQAWGGASWPECQFCGCISFVKIPQDIQLQFMHSSVLFQLEVYMKEKDRIKECE